MSNLREEVLGSVSFERLVQSVRHLHRRIMAMAMSIIRTWW